MIKLFLQFHIDIVHYLPPTNYHSRMYPGTSGFIFIIDAIEKCFGESWNENRSCCQLPGLTNDGKPNLKKPTNFIRGEIKSLSLEFEVEDDIII